MSQINVNTIGEYASGNGVTVDGVVLKDGNVPSGLTEVDNWQLTANITSDGDITSNLQRMVGDAVGYKGTGMTVSSGVFTFPSTGLWEVIVHANFEINNDPSAEISIKACTNGSSYSRVGGAFIGNRSNTGAHYYGVEASQIIDVTDTSQVKVMFATSSLASGSDVLGGTDEGYGTHFKFIRLGDT